MTKKKIRYSEFPAPTAGPPAAPQPAPPAEPAPAKRSRAPLDLARALAAARAAEDAAATIAASVAPVAPTPPAPVQPVSATAPRVAAARLTPIRGTATISRPTPVLGNGVISRPTPIRGSMNIVRGAASAPAANAWSATSTALRDRARLRTGTVDLLLFSIGQEWFGVELAAVEEAIDLPIVRHVPEMPPAMLGVITVRGSLTSVYSPASALGVVLGAPSSALVFRRERGRLGIAVDDVDDVHTLDLAQLRDAPSADTGDGILLGVLRNGDTLLALVDAEALIAACQTVPAMEIA